MPTYQITDWSDVHLHCQFESEYSWQRAEAGEGAPSGPWAAFSGEDEEHPWLLELAGFYLAREMNCEDWLLIRCEQSDEKFDGFLQADNGQKMIRTVLPEDRFAVTSAIKDENRMLYGRLTVSMADTRTAAFAKLIKTLGSLSLLRPTNVLTAEPLVMAFAPTYVPFRFSIPSSWYCAKKSEASGACSYTVQQVSDAGKLGRIDVDMDYGGKSVDELFAREIEKLTQLPAKVGSGMIYDLPARDGFRSGRAISLPIETQGTPLEATIIVISGHDEAAATNLSIRLLGHRRDASPEAWALNKRALEIVYMTTGMGKMPGKPGEKATDSAGPVAPSEQEDATSLGDLA